MLIKPFSSIQPHQSIVINPFSSIQPLQPARSLLSLYRETGVNAAKIFTLKWFLTQRIKNSINPTPSSRDGSLLILLGNRGKCCQNFHVKAIMTQCIKNSIKPTPSSHNGSLLSLYRETGVNAAKIYTMTPFHYISCATLLVFSLSWTFPTLLDPPILLGPTRVNAAKIYATIPFHNISSTTFSSSRTLDPPILLGPTRG